MIDIGLWPLCVAAEHRTPICQVQPSKAVSESLTVVGSSQWGNQGLRAGMTSRLVYLIGGMNSNSRRARDSVRTEELALLTSQDVGMLARLSSLFDSLYVGADCQKQL
ncbi:hypothetical protein N656DRAFT_774425 [Canariomyces notabilis]|uniref:Uncharacterized protein n=1 Tax=Canariomyces notabilis TaxID=2074819 RepID=A0AAN6YX67_9PEZI|nr:hypothetical protein N656DRAFT_774425 [Canariomyces arenarius]